ncbi:thioredoxin domain-containing protein [Hydrogenothermus marinus]|uniref:Spermatogenesis-associated protein 20-like TRX domain-containing protein n=1 Tax=Hydrogenothermus marinus TaxID=133270 RepID=A0A3M0BKE1_9AQUI|nr:thioredoxin domain-containing protein [Hydrogenothermus marinus]RMA97086.1 hypothetical protein CLV39_0740 [Hydrogenothermus marinus]
MPNRLINEKSPYLQQHANNPVDWYPWCEEAFEKAKKENKPIFLSIGYSTCHWCHVMEKESFEDPEIAKMMNETFVNIKVDREERPDIDQVYMQVCMLLTGRGGWPLTIIMTPDKKPFFAGTYIPKESRYSIIGMKELIPQIKKIWEENKEALEERSEKILKALQEDLKPTYTDNRISDHLVKTAYKHFEYSFDKRYGGFGEAPKFPSPHNLLFLLRYYFVFKDENALKMVEKTLTEMRKGGIYDNIGYGFHRYSTDKRWLLPHFEKMLYDQAMLLMAYTEGFQATKNENFKETVYQISEYLFRDMESPEGAFSSAEDADSEGEEGKFYTFTYKELKDILKEDFEIFAKISDIKEEGNYLEEATGQPSYRNIIYQSKNWEVLEKETGISKEKLKDIWRKSLKKLFNIREKRVRPLKDTKILTDWNGLIIKALAQAGVVFNNKEFIEKAKKSADFIINNMYKDGILYHRYKDGDIAFEGNLDDYAFLSYGLFELYQATFDKKYLDLSKELTDKLIENFWDKTSGGFFYTSENNKDVIVRNKEAYDGAYPSGNSVAYNMLVNLYKITQDNKYLDYIENTEKAFYNQIKVAPQGFSMFLNGYLNLVYGSEVVIEGNKEEALDTRFYLEKEYIPLKVLDYKPSSNLKIYVCKNFTCKYPVDNKEDALKQLLEG